MNLIDVVERTPAPVPWEEGVKIPWHEPAFSERMLREHLSQEHDAASRRLFKIDAAVEWIHRELLKEHPTRILDLGCGPGLYASRLARLGHECVGIDFSPASIAHAREEAQREGLACTYREEDLRSADFGAGYGLVMLIYGELNPFRLAEAEAILRKARDALAEGGLLLLEVSTFDSLEEAGGGAPSWYAAREGLFSERPHLCLTDHSWDADRHVATNRHYVVDAASGEVTRHAESLQAYTDDEYRALLARCGFGPVAFYPSLTGKVDEEQSYFLVIVAHRGNESCPRVQEK